MSDRRANLVAGSMQAVGKIHHLPSMTRLKSVGHESTLSVIVGRNSGENSIGRPGLKNRLGNFDIRERKQPDRKPIPI